LLVLLFKVDGEGVSRGLTKLNAFDLSRYVFFISKLALSGEFVFNE
jgi:hypothetical protein